MLFLIRTPFKKVPSVTPVAANITSPDPLMIVVLPFDVSSLEQIEKSILSSDLGMNPNNDGKVIRLTVPPLTEERRTELVKLVHKLIEEGKIAIRNVIITAYDAA